MKRSRELTSVILAFILTGSTCMAQIGQEVKLIEQSIVSDCCGAPVVRMKNERYGCIWRGHYCCEQAPATTV